MLGKSLKELGLSRRIVPEHISVKESVFPFNRFPNADIILGPEMKSTGEVMGIDRSFGIAFAKSQMAAGFQLPREGTVFISVHDQHKDKMVPIARTLKDMGFRLLATRGTAAYLKGNGIQSDTICKVSEGRPHVVDFIKNGDIHLVINTGIGRRSSLDAYHIRRGALMYNIPYTTTIAGAKAVSEAIGALQKEEWQVCPLQEYYKEQGPGSRVQGTGKKKEKAAGSRRQATGKDKKKQTAGNAKKTRQASGKQQGNVRRPKA
jgi:carbamoyl-phosphate synthase large subunit